MRHRTSQKQIEQMSTSVRTVPLATVALTSNMALHASGQGAMARRRATTPFGAVMVLLLAGGALLLAGGATALRLPAGQAQAPHTGKNEQRRKTGLEGRGVRKFDPWVPTAACKSHMFSTCTSRLRLNALRNARCRPPNTIISQRAGNCCSSNPPQLPPAPSASLPSPAAAAARTTPPSPLLLLVAAAPMPPMLQPSCRKPLQPATPRPPLSPHPAPPLPQRLPPTPRPPPLPQTRPPQALHLPYLCLPPALKP